MGEELSKEREPKAGDVIEFDRGAYMHYGIAVDSQHVVHVTSVDSKGGSHHFSSGRGPRAVVAIARISKVAGNCKYRINNMLDDTYEPRPTEKIVRDALAMIGQEIDYDLLKVNCEHFATHLRYGSSQSRQAKNGIIGISTAGVVLGAAAVFGAAFAISSALEKKEREEE